jgi:quercetin dioxygenase-like cupin family protein
MDGLSLDQLVEEHLAAARESSAGRSSVTVHGGREHHLRQTLIALAGGRSLGEHESPGEATLQVLRGRVRLHAGDDSWDGGAGDFLLIPPQRHDLEAREDAAVLLTVANRLAD